MTYAPSPRALDPILAEACAAMERAGRPAELIIMGRDGRIRDNRTYGRDPRKTRG